MLPMTRRSKRELEHGINDLEVRAETLSVAELLSYETEKVSEDLGIVRIVETGELRQINRGQE